MIARMDGEQHPTRIAWRQARESTIEQLSEGFARDELSLDEFDKRVGQRLLRAPQPNYTDWSVTYRWLRAQS